MLIFLPPSEGKTTAESGAPVDLKKLVAPQLTAARTEVASALIETCKHENALSVLGVGPRLADVVGQNTTLWDNPAQAAHKIYTGVLFGAANLGAIAEEPKIHTTLADQVLIFSALWGLVRPSDSIPAYRLSAGTDLPGVGPLGSFWKKTLAPYLDSHASGQLIVDCRSGAYQKMWLPSDKTLQKLQCELVGVRVEELRDGKRKVVSHHAKYYRGLLSGHLLRHGSKPTDAAELLDFACHLASMPESGLRHAQLIRDGQAKSTLVLTKG